MSILSGIMKVGEGYSASEQDIPIDIHYNKLLDWLIDRKKANDSQLKESATKLISLVSYEIPSLKKTIDKSQKQITELSRKETETRKNAVQYKEKFEAKCKELGIDSESKDIEEQIANLAIRLPDFFAEIINSIKRNDISEALHFYAAFHEYLNVTIQKDGSVAFPKINEKSICTYLRFAQQYGNNTVSNYRKFLKGEEIPEEEQQIITVVKTEEKNDEKEITIDWGTTDGAEATIDWGISSETSSETSKSTINWEVAEDSTPAEINWDVGGIEVVEASAASLAATDTDSKKSPVEQETLLSNNQTRNELINDLLELKYFFQQRITELEVQDDVTAMTQYKLAPKIIQHQSASDMKRYFSAVESILNSLTSSAFQQLLEIKTSKQYVKRLASSINQLFSTHLRLIGSARDMLMKKSEVEDSLNNAYPQLRKITEKAKQLKREIQNNISKQFNNRPVNLIGDISNL